jgi:uncharacterized RDD family membrane protein YckC
MNDQELASRGERLAAYLLEIGLALPFGLVGGVLGFQLGRTRMLHRPISPSLVFALALTIVCLTALSIIQMYWLATKGQTLGKRWVKIRIVRLDGSNPGFVHAVLLRGFVGAAIYLTFLLLFGQPLAYVYLLADLLLIFGAQRRCLHDLVGGTKVVRVTNSDPGSVVTPPAIG